MSDDKLRHKTSAKELTIESVQTAIGRLLTADGITAKFNVPANIITDLAASEFMPHYRVKGIEQPLFQPQESKEWMAANLVARVRGQKLIAPELFVIGDAEVVPLGVPKALSGLEGLKELCADLWCGIYFLCHQGKVVYVGQSTSVFARVQDHASNKEFDRVFFVRVPSTLLNSVERQFIELLKPKLNIALNRTKTVPASPSEPLERTMDVAEAPAVDGIGMRGID